MESKANDLIQPTKVFVFDDDKGFIELLEVFGNDLTVVNAARVSLFKESHDFTDQDKKLLRYLAVNHHISPFFHPVLRFRFKMPIFVAREWFRHTVGFARNEVSRRYVNYDAECFVPPIIREMSVSIKQGSMDTEVEDKEYVHDKIAEHMATSCTLYNELIELKVAPELARTVLPQSMYTEFIETGSLYGYIRLCTLRSSPTAQYEIRAYSTILYRYLQQHFPACIAAFQAVSVVN